MKARIFIVVGLLLTGLLAGLNTIQPAIAEIKALPSPFADLRVFPNPWRVNVNNGTPITFDHLPAVSTVKIFTISGHWIQTLNAAGTSVSWNLNNNKGDKVASGLYLYAITPGPGTSDTSVARGQLHILR